MQHRCIGPPRQALALFCALTIALGFAAAGCRQAKLVVMVFVPSLLALSP